MATRDKRKRPAAPATPYKPRTLAEVMRICLFVNKEGCLWMIHEKPLPEALAWLEYDGDDNQITLIGEKGRVMPLGIDVPDECKEAMLKTQNALIAHIEEQEVKDMVIVPITVRKLDLN